MEKIRKNLKLTSFCILLVTTFRLITSFLTFFNGGLEVTAEMIPAGSTREVVYISLLIAWILGLIFFLPSYYVGFKGLKVAKNPEGTGKAHIVWATIMLVFSIISVISMAGNLSSSANTTMATFELVEVVFCGLLYLFYVVEAKKLRANS